MKIVKSYSFSRWDPVVKLIKYSPHKEVRDAFYRAICNRGKAHIFWSKKIGGWVVLQVER